MLFPFVFFSKTPMIQMLGMLNIVPEVSETLLITLYSLLCSTSVISTILYLPVSVQFSCSVMSNSLWLHGLQHARPPCPSPIPRACSNSCPSSQWCHPTISSSVIPFSSCLQSFPASGSFPMSQLLAWGGQSVGVSASASVLPMNTQGWWRLLIR